MTLAPPSTPAARPPSLAPVASRRDLLGLQGFPPDTIRGLLARTRELIDLADDPATRLPRLAGRTVATLFFEPSTRTRTSFALAARRLSADIIDLSTAASSVTKGESLVDTARTIEAMGVSGMIVRTREAGAPHIVARTVACPVINAGDGRHEHPTQALLDLYTIAEAHGRTAGAKPFSLDGLTVAFVGDLRSSRVARSGIAGLTALGARVVGTGPPALVGPELESLGCRILPSLDDVLPLAHAVVMLRVQFERHEGTGVIASPREYRAQFGLTIQRARTLRPDAIVMHPGPMNRGLEIDGPVADGPRSRILRQVTVGVAARMAVLEWAIAGPAA